MADRLKDGKIEVSGIQYQLDKNENGKHGLHGGAFGHGFSHRHWDSEVKANGVQFTLVSEAGDCGYPS